MTENVGTKRRTYWAIHDTSPSGDYGFKMHMHVVIKFRAPSNKLLVSKMSKLTKTPQS
jgi:hypothetical protein